MMTLTEKLKSSKLISCDRVKASKYGIKSSKRRIVEFVIFVLMSTFTIFSKIVNKGDKDNLTDKFLDYSIVCIFINIGLTFIMKFMNKSVFALNHNKIYKLFRLLNSCSKVLVFFFTMVAYFNKIIPYWNQYVISFSLTNNLEFKSTNFNVSWLYNIFSLKDYHLTMSFYKDFLLDDKKHLITYALCLLTVVAFIPTVIYFVFTTIKSYVLIYALNVVIVPLTFIFLIPILNVFLLFKILTRPMPLFKYCYFDKNDKNYVFVEKRQIDGKYNKFKWFWKNFFLFLPLVIITVLSYVILGMGVYIYKKYDTGFNIVEIARIMVDTLKNKAFFK